MLLDHMSKSSLKKPYLGKISFQYGRKPLMKI